MDKGFYRLVALPSPPKLHQTPIENTLSIIEKFHAPNNAPKRLYIVV
jgi:hypothetical protein